nr:DUF1989 domain-containing protein [Granulosicoccus sp.]
MLIDPAQYRHPYQKGSVLVPGLPTLAPGVERHPVPGGGSRAVEIIAGDTFSVLDEQGLQSAELVFFTPDGRSDPAVFGVASGVAATGIQQTLSRGDASGRRALDALIRTGFDIASAQAVQILGDSRPGDYETFTAHTDGLLIVCAPGDDMSPDCQNVATPVILYLQRANPELLPDKRLPPDPLADPVQDLNVPPGTATAYEVKAGEYIQVLDVQGRECSDFQALSKRSLDDGDIELQ